MPNGLITVHGWLYRGLHSLDVPFLHRHRPLWDVVVILFMVGGAALSGTSLVLAWRVLGRTLTYRPVDVVFSARGTVRARFP